MPTYVTHINFRHYEISKPGNTRCSRIPCTTSVRLAHDEQQPHRPDYDRLPAADADIALGFLYQSTGHRGDLTIDKLQRPNKLEQSRANTQ